MRTVIELRTAEVRVEALDELLASSQRTDRLEEAMAHLDAIDDLLGELVGNTELTHDEAAQLGRLRDEVGSHVLAARAMDAVDLAPSKVAGTLQRCALAARSAIKAVAQEVQRRSSA